MVGVAERVGERGSRVEAGEVERVGVRETETVGEGEREGKGEGVVRRASAETHAANTRLMRSIAKRVFCVRRLPAILSFGLFPMGLGDTQDTLQGQGSSNDGDPLAVYQKNMDASRKENATRQ
jgi:hypothetical protein